MIPSRVASRPLPVAHRASKLPQGASVAQRRCFQNQGKSRVAVATRKSGSRTAGLFLSIAIGGGVLYSLGYPRTLHAEEIPAPAEVRFEEPRRKASSREENRDLISSQHLQVKKSWENPGVYAWGSNTGRVVAPDSDESIIRAPRRIPYFDGKLIRDIKLDRMGIESAY